MSLDRGNLDDCINAKGSEHQLVTLGEIARSRLMNPLCIFHSFNTVNTCQGQSLLLLLFELVGLAHYRTTFCGKIKENVYMGARIL